MAVQKALGLGDATVYGVALPGQDGKAGMAGIAVPDAVFDLPSLKAALAKALPPYARPIFIRRLTAVDTTGSFLSAPCVSASAMEWRDAGTYKLRKTDYQKEGIDLAKVGPDPVFFLNNRSGLQSYSMPRRAMQMWCMNEGEYERMTEAIHQDILAGKVPF